MTDGLLDLGDSVCLSLSSTNICTSLASSSILDSVSNLVCLVELELSVSSFRALKLLGLTVPNHIFSVILGE